MCAMGSCSYTAVTGTCKAPSYTVWIAQGSVMGYTRQWHSNPHRPRGKPALIFQSYLSSALTASCDMKLVLCGDGHEHKMLWPRGLLMMRHVKCPSFTYTTCTHRAIVSTSVHICLQSDLYTSSVHQQPTMILIVLGSRSELVKTHVFIHPHNHSHMAAHTRNAINNPGSSGVGHSQPNTDGQRHIIKFNDPAQSLKPQHQEKRECAH